ncbi:Fic family protein [Niveispirillum fermenti]|uniref:Fic family protein n=1 Tax=Niveispirillum fermenti TaxID=1233113 RepID=UPI003A84C653
MTGSKTPNGYDLGEAVQYHYGKFPPAISDYARIMKPLTRATAALARYDQMLKSMHNNDILLAPLRSQEAVISSRMEGTVSTLDEVLRIEAEYDEDADAAHGNARSEAVEVYLYSRAMDMAQKSIQDGLPICSWLVRSAHRVLLGFGRGAHQSPGEFKTEQNYLADRLRRQILFVPISPEFLNDGMEALFRYMADDDQEILIRTALAHLEFEALHPFKDGNGRIGRMIIPLMLWKAGVISQPYFYISDFFEQNKDEYIDRMRAASASGAWDEWVLFFLSALETQARQNLETAERIALLYEAMKERFRDILSSKWTISALDFIFTRPVFRNSTFTSRSGIPVPTAHKFTRVLADAGLLKIVEPASGRRPALYAFEPLLALVRS